MEEDSLSRRERLARLKQLKFQSAAIQSISAQEEEDGVVAVDHDKSDKDNADRNTDINDNSEYASDKSDDDDDDELKHKEPRTVESVAKKLEKEAISSLVSTLHSNNSNGETNGAGVDLDQLAAKKVDWDLKRDLQTRLDQLEKLTQRRIAELIRQRLEVSSGAK